MNIARTIRSIAPALCAVSLLIVLSGCKAEHLESSGVDDAFLRLPNEKSTETPIAGGPLILTTTGAQWTYLTQTEIRSRDVTQAATPKMGQEQVVVSGQKTIGKSTGTAFQVFQNGKAFREEVLRLDDQGLSLVAAGISSGSSAGDTMTITPGIPLVEFPIREGATTSWEGILRLTKNNVQAPGYAHSRVSGRETIELKLKSGVKKVEAYKVETMISTTVNRRPIYLYTARWFTPGMGMVRQIVISGTQVITKQLVQFSPGRGNTQVAAAH